MSFLKAGEVNLFRPVTEDQLNTMDAHGQGESGRMP